MKKVVILGGGVAGMSAAHELIERGFAVEVYEAKQIPGGKARSVPVPEKLLQGPPGRGKNLPGEHGFRFFPRFYKHVIDTMGRIPYGENRTVVDNLVNTSHVELARYGKPSIFAPCHSSWQLDEVKIVLDDLALLFTPDLGVSREDLAFFGSRVWQIITSCRERRNDEYEKLDWWEFIDAENRSEEYRKVLAQGITRSLVAAKAHLASTKTIGDIFVQLLFDTIEPGVSSDRVLNGPTNDVWIHPWLEYLTKCGVRYHLGAKVTAIHCSEGRIQGATVEQNGRSLEVRGDYYIAAVPVERMAQLTTPSLITADPGLGHLEHLSRNGVSWMVGIQLYLREDVPLNHGHTIYSDSPWALTSISQKQFWPDVDLSQYADGRVRGILSVDISDWDTPGFNGKTAKQCTHDEIKTEVWEQIKASQNVAGEELLKDEYLHTYFLEPDIYREACGFEVNEEPLLVNLINTWALRPEAATRIPNLFLASDYVRTYTDLATMEGANEAARRAVNAILDACGADAPRCAIWELHEPEIFAPWRAMDRIRYQQGLPWDDTAVRLGLSALKIADKAVEMLEQGLGMNAGRPFTELAKIADAADRRVRALGIDTGPPFPGATTAIPGGLHAGEIRQDLLARMEKTLQSLALPTGEKAESLTRSGRVKILPE